MGAVAAGRLAVAADPVAGEREQERGEPERPERRGVDEQPGEEAADGADDRAAEERDRDERDEQEVGHAAEHVEIDVKIETWRIAATKSSSAGLDGVERSRQVRDRLRRRGR